MLRITCSFFPFGVLLTVWTGPSGADDASGYMVGCMPCDAFDALPKTTLKVDVGVLDVAFAPGRLALRKEKSSRG